MTTNDASAAATKAFASKLVMAKPGSLAAQPGGSVTTAMLLASGVFLGLGLVLPVVQTKMLFLFAQQHSLLGFGFGLLGKGDVVLAAIVLGFSVVFPLAKYAKLASLWTKPASSVGRRKLRSIEAFAKWSMLDVFVVALIVFSVKSSGLGTALAMPGLWFFAASILLMMVTTRRIVERLGEDGGTLEDR